MKNMTITELKDDLIRKGFQITPYSVNEINQAIEFFGQIPKTLLEYYQLIGNIDLTNHHDAHILILSPGDLIKINKDFAFIKFADEYCGMFDLAFKREDAGINNPEIYMSGEVVYGVLEIYEEKEAEWTDANLLFNYEDDGILYLSGQVPELSEENKADDDTNVLDNLLTSLNYYFRYDEAFLK